MLPGRRLRQLNVKRAGHGMEDRRLNRAQSRQGSALAKIALQFRLNPRFKIGHGRLAPTPEARQEVEGELCSKN